MVTKNGKSVKSELDKYGKTINVYEKSEHDDEFPEQPIASYSYDGVTGELIESQDNTVGSKWTMNTNSYFTTVKHKGATNYEKTVYLDKSIPTTEEITVDDSIFTYKYAYETNATGLRYPDNRISEIKISGLEGNAVCKYTPHYDNIGRFSKDEICPSEGNGPAIVSHEYEYPQKPNGRTENLVKKVTATDRVDGSASENTTEYSYEYDANGNITKITEDGKVITYEYDGKQRLVRENNEISDTTTVYNYYDNGNLRFKSEMPYTDVDLDLRPHVTDEYYESAPFCGQTICGTSVCAEKTQLHIHTEELAGKTPIRYDYDYLNRLTTINGEVIAEYANDCDLGKPTKYKGKQLSWDGNKLTSVAKNGKVRTFNYDVRNYLVSAVTDGDTSKFFYDEKGNLLREERTKNGVNYKVNYIYAGGEAIGFTLRGQWKIDLDGAKAQDFPFYYVKDAQGNVRKIVDRMGNCVVKYNYNAWGKETVTPVESTWEFPLELNSDGTVKKFCRASDIAELNRLTYRGYFYNRELGLYYLINRYYDPETGRFISADDAEYLDFQTLYGSNRYMGNDSNATFLGNKPLFSKYKQFINKPVVVDDTPVYEFTLDEYFSNFSTAVSVIQAFLVGTLGSLAKNFNMMSELEFIDNSLSAISDYSNYIGIGISVVLGVVDNVKKGAKPLRVVSDALVDTAVGLASVWATMALTGAMCSAIGSAVPGIGTVVGLVAGAIVGLIIYIARDTINTVKESLYDDLNRIFGTAA